MKYTHLFLISALVPFISQAMQFKNNKSVTIQFDFHANTDIAKIICAHVKSNYAKKQPTKKYDEIVQLDPNGIDIQKQCHKNKNKQYTTA
jgi:uncharacterized membrane protein